MEEFEKFSSELKEIYNYVDNELSSNEQLKIDRLLLDYNVGEVLDIISEYAPTSMELLSINQNVCNRFISLLYKKREYIESLCLSDEKFGKLLTKATNDGAGQKQHLKSESFYYNEEDPEKYLDDILKRLIECVNLYYNKYHNKSIHILLGDGTKLELQFLYKNLLHILGITKQQVIGNSELKKALNIKDEEIEKLTSIEILERIIKDIETNKDILCFEMKKRILQRDALTSGKIIETQLSPDTKTELLPFDKIDLKTRAFITSGPFSDVSVITGVADNAYFYGGDARKLPKDREIQQVRISKVDFSKFKREKIVLDKDGKITMKPGDYVFSGYTKNPGYKRTIRSTQIGTTKPVIEQSNGTKRDNIGIYKKMFQGQTPIPVVSVEDPNGGTDKIFSSEQQIAMYLSLYEDFSGEGGMDFSLYKKILITFIKDFESKLEKKAANNRNSEDVGSNSKGRCK